MVLIRFRDDGGCEVYDMSTGSLYYLPSNVDAPKVINKILSQPKIKFEKQEIYPHYLRSCIRDNMKWGHYELH